MKYGQIVRFVSETPWAILPSKLATIVDLIRFRADGNRLSDEEIENRLQAARKGSPQTVSAPSGPAIGVLPLRGVLVPHAGMMVDVSTLGTDLETWAQDLQAMVDDTSVAAIVLDIYSPGGSVGLVQETAAQVLAARKSKPIVAVANTMAASAAYWIASACSELSVTPSGQVGSVGVYAAHEDISAALEAEGVKVTLISAGDFKTEGNPFEALSDEARAYMQQQVNSTYDAFVNAVAKGRGITANAVLSSFGQGRMLDAGDALAAGMVDRVETIGQAIGRLSTSLSKPAGGRRGSVADPTEFELELPVGVAARPFLRPSLAAGTFGSKPIGGPTGGRTVQEILAEAGLTETLAEIFTGSVTIAAERFAGPIPYTETEVVDVPWDAGEQVKKLPSKEGPLRQMHAWVDSSADADLKGSYKFPHHQVSDPGGVAGDGDETVGAANVNGVRNALARLTDADIPEGDKAGVRAHLQHHLDDFDRKTNTGADATAGALNHRKENLSMDSITQLRARQDEIKSRMQEIDGDFAGQLLPDASRTEFEALEQEWDLAEATCKELARRQAAIVAKGATRAPGTAELATGSLAALRGGRSTQQSRIPENIWDISSYRSIANGVDDLGMLYRSGALKALEAAQFPGFDSKKTICAVPDPKAHVEQLLARDTEDGKLARHILITGSESYRRAWAKSVQGLPVNQREQQALDMFGLTIGTPSDGGYAIPYTLDPTVILASNGAINPIRAVARQVQITGHQWLGVTTSDGVVASYGPELTVASNNSPALAQPVLEVEKAQAFVPLSIEVSQDWVGVEAELAKLFADAKDVLEANKFFLGQGHGSHEPEGIVTALAAAGIPSGVVIKTASVNTFARDDLYTLENALAPRFEPNASWIANRAFYNAVRGVTDDTFNIFVPIQQGTGRDMGGNTGFQLLGYPAWRASEMSKLVSVGGEHIAILGDFEQFLVVDRIGMSVEFIPHLFDTGTGYPLGSRGLYAYWRNSSQCLTTNAFRMLNVASS